MYKYFLLLLCLVASGPALTQTNLTDQVTADYNYLESLYHHLHRNPEISFQEANTSARLAKELRGLGFDVTENVGGYGIVGVIRNGSGPTVLVRADMDALPVVEMTGLPYASKARTTDELGADVGVMHACGHDIHMTVFTGTARQLAAQKDSWSGTLVMIGQPAEERGAGARAMLRDGLFERFPRPDYNLALHVSSSSPAGMIHYVPGYALANVDSVDITVYGVGGHGAYPHTTKDPIVISAQIINSLQTLVSRQIPPIDSGVVTVGSIHGGTKHNIIPEEVHLQLTVRSYKDQVRDTLIEGIKHIARYQALTMGVPEDRLPVVEVKDERTPSMYNDPALTERMAGVLKELLGDAAVQETDPVMGGEDFAEYGRVDPRIPSLLLWLGAVDPANVRQSMQTGEPLPSLHSPVFAPLPKPTIITGVKALTTMALELLDKK